MIAKSVLPKPTIVNQYIITISSLCIDRNLLFSLLPPTYCGANKYFKVNFCLSSTFMGK